MEQIRKKLENFWFYYKIPLLIGLAAVLVLGYLGVRRLNTTEPDYHIGLVREIPCTDDQLQRLEARFAAAGEDCNGDGQILVKIHTYYVDLADTSENAGVSNADAVQALDADLIGKVSGLFLLEDPETFRRVTGGILAEGSLSVEEGLALTVRADAPEAYLELAGNMTVGSDRP